MKGQFGRSILVSVDRRSHLILVVPSDTSKQGTTDNPVVFARQVAEYARSHYGRGNSLTTVTVILDAGPDADSTQVFGSYTWTADDLGHVAAKSAVSSGTQRSD